MGKPIGRELAAGLRCVWANGWPEAAKHDAAATGRSVQIRLRPCTHLVPLCKAAAAVRFYFHCHSQHRNDRHYCASPAAAALYIKKFTKAGVAKHVTEKDCWVIVGTKCWCHQVYARPSWGKLVMKLGKDATEEFDMLHQREVIEKYAPESTIGVVSD